MSKNLSFALVASAVVVGAASFVLSRQGAGSSDSPRVQVEPLVDLGVIETGRTAEGRFEITNSGGAVLTISNARTDCGCLGAWLVKDGNRTPFQRAELGPGERVVVELHFLVRGETGRPIRQSLVFATNDPENPEVRVACQAVPGGGVSATPNAVVLGTLTPGEMRRCSVELWDDGKLGGCQVSEVVSTNSRSVAANFVAAEAGVKPANTEQNSLGRFVGRVELTISAPESPAPISESVSVFIVGNKSALMTLPVTGNVLPRFQLLPADIDLPRASASGPYYAARVICRNTRGSRLTVTPATVPEGLVVRVEEGEDASPVKMVTVEVPPGVGRSGPRTTRQVVLTVSDGEATTTLTLGVTVNPAE